MGSPDEIRLGIMKGELKFISPEEIKKELPFTEIQKVLEENYQMIIEILRVYIDMPEEYYPLVSLWIIGTYMHDNFETFPLLFINATKGSGKSRLLKLIAAMSYHGKIVLDLKEAVLFRTAKDSTICIDEFEGVGKKENSTLRTLINAAYKKGTAVERMRKVVKQGQEQQVVERFDLYTPVAMANIWGMEDVLSDRCFSVVLEKSSDQKRTQLMEDFDESPSIKKVQKMLNELKCSLCSVVTKKNTRAKWNSYIYGKNNNITTLTTLHTFTIITTQTTMDEDELDTFKKIHETNIDGRNLELFFPLFIIAKIINPNVFNEIINLSKKIIDDKKSEEYAESKDVSLIDFISHCDKYRGSFISVFELCKEFKLVTMEDPEEERWLNPKWIGRALKRSKLVIQKRRVGKGTEVMLDIDKAKQQIRRFKEVIVKGDKNDILSHPKGWSILTENKR